MVNFNIRYDMAFVEVALKSMGVPCHGDDNTRSIFITPYNGCYGNAGYVVTIEGSPPLATFILEKYGQMLVGISSSGRTRVAIGSRGNKDLHWIKEYLNTHIKCQIDDANHRASRPSGRN